MIHNNTVSIGPYNFVDIVGDDIEKCILSPYHVWGPGYYISNMLWEPTEKKTFGDLHKSLSRKLINPPWGCEGNDPVYLQMNDFLGWCQSEWELVNIKKDKLCYLKTSVNNFLLKVKHFLFAVCSHGKDIATIIYM